MLNAPGITGDTTVMNEWLEKRREDNMPYLQGRSFSSAEDFTSIRILSVQALRNHALGEDLLVHYEKKYEYHG